MKLISTFIGLCLFVFFVCISLFASAQICSNPTGVIYGLTNNGTLYPITVSNGAVGSSLNPAYTGNTPNQANALGYNSVNGRFYYFKRNPGVATQEFVSFDPATNSYAYLASCPTAKTVHAGCASFDGLGYYTLDVSGSLYYYNILLNSWKLITSTFYDQFGTNITPTFASLSTGDIAIDGNGNLWILCSSSTNYGLYRLNAPIPTILGAASLTVKQVIAPTTATPGTSFLGIAFNPTGQIYLATGPGDDKLYLLNNNYTLTLQGTFSVSGVGNDLTSCAFPVSVLPVAWESYSVSLQNNQTVNIGWSVSQEDNIKGYRVERSADGTNWVSLGFQAPADKSGVSHAYSYIDGNPANGKNYYRVVSVDMDGKESYSNVKAVAINDNSSVSLWPNPAKDVVYVQNRGGSGSFKSGAMIFDQSGRILSQVALQDGINTINLSRFPTGTYVIRILLANGETFSQKLLRQ